MISLWKFWLWVWLLSLSWLGSSIQPAQAETNSDLSCPNAQTLSQKLITDMCWDCMLPIKIAGVNPSSDQDTDIPAGAVKNPLCMCKQKYDLPTVGYTVGFWQPVRLVELVRVPGCLMSLNGTKVKVGNEQEIGTIGTGGDTLTNLAFYHYHFYAFPLLQVIGLLDSSLCQDQSYSNIDLLYMSEIDPSWNYPEISNLVFPETKIFANELSINACIGDTLASVTTGSIPHLWWCAGSWGTLYPITGFVNGTGSPARITSLLATRALASSHRRGFEKLTIGKEALCHAPTNFTFNPEQYRLSMLYPMPQNSKNQIGRSTLLWGEASGVTDASYIVWRWRDCCSTIGTGQH